MVVHFYCYILIFAGYFNTFLTTSNAYSTMLLLICNPIGEREMQTRCSKMLVGLIVALLLTGGCNQNGLR